MLWNCDSTWWQNCGREEQGRASDSYCFVSKKGSKLETGEVQKAACRLPQVDHRMLFPVDATEFGWR